MTDDPAIEVADRWTYVWGARRRPHVHPLRAPSGVVLSRNAPEDHPWHHGLWFTIKFVNGENFWETYDAYGVLRHEDAPEVREVGGRTTVSGTLRWIRPDRESVVLHEERSLTHVPIGGDAYAIDVVTSLEPLTEVVLDRTPFTTWGGYGGLAFRGRGDFTDTRLSTPDDDGVERLLGAPAPWCDLSGRIEGTTAGISFFDAPTNPHHPVPWYASTRAATYGDEGWSNFVNAAFLWDGPYTLGRGERLDLRYRVVVHDGIWETARVGDAYAAWLDEPQVAR